MAKRSMKPVKSRGSGPPRKRKPNAREADKPSKAKRPKRPAPASKPSIRRNVRLAGKRAGSDSELAMAPDVVPIEVEPGPLDQSFEKLRSELKHWVNKGRFTKVRFRLRGKPILPDIPIGAFVAAEAATFWWAGLLQAALVNVGAKALLQVELVSDADLEVARGKAALLSGDLPRALELFRHALEMDRDCASAHLNLGIAHKLGGNPGEARANFARALELAPSGPLGEEARRLLEQLAGPKT